MTIRRTIPPVLASGALLAGLLAGPAAADPTAVTFRVTIENVSTLGQLDTDRAGGQIPLSPGVYAVHRGGEVLFTPGEPASEGVERIAEDGAPAVSLADLAATNRVRTSGLLDGDGPGTAPILTGQTGTFEVTASRGDRLSILTMFVQSNDLFFADDGEGIALFERGRPVAGDVTDQLLLWDAGTEEDTAPGTGPYQVLAQPGPDSGPDEDEDVTLAAETGDGFDLPAVADVIRVTVTPIG